MFKQTRIRSRRIVNNLRCYYNFFNNEKFEFKSAILSANFASKKVLFKDKSDIVEININLDSEKLIVKEFIDFEYLLQKTTKTQEFLQKINKDEEKENETGKLCRAKNAKCNICTSKMAFNISELYDNFHQIKVQDLKTELKKHHHPMNRLTNNRQNNKIQKRNELIEHYKFVHSVPN